MKTFKGYHLCCIISNPDYSRREEVLWGQHSGLDSVILYISSIESSTGIWWSYIFLFFLRILLILEFPVPITYVAYKIDSWMPIVYQQCCYIVDIKDFIFSEKSMPQSKWKLALSYLKSRNKTVILRVWYNVTYSRII